MKESMKVAKTLAWNIIPTTIKEDLLKNSKLGIHIHCPAGGTPKDGPSAGTAITISVISQLLNTPINHEYAITGEIDLNGRVLPIGGLDAKVEGAKLAGIKYVLCPKDNEDDLKKIRNKQISPEAENFKVILISTIYEAIELVLINHKQFNFIKLNI